MLTSQDLETTTEEGLSADATDVRDVGTFVIAYQEPIGASDDEEDAFDAENREFFGIWERDGTHLERRYGASGQRPEYREHFETLETEADVEEFLD